MKAEVRKEIGLRMPGHQYARCCWKKNCQQWIIICRDEYEAVLFRATSLLTFFGALWIIEVIASGKGDLTRVALQWHDVRLDRDLVRIHIR